MTKRENTETRSDQDERVAIALDPEVALRALLQVDPESEPAPPKRAGQRAVESGRKRSPS